MNYITIESILGFTKNEHLHPYPHGDQTGIQQTFSLHTLQKKLKKKGRNLFHLHMDNFLHNLGQRKFYIVMCGKSWEGKSEQGFINHGNLVNRKLNNALRFLHL